MASASQAISKATMLYHELKNTMYAGASIASDDEMNGKISTLVDWIDEADRLQLKEPPMSRAQLKQRIDQLRFDTAELRRAKSEHIRQMQQRAAAEKRREELLGTQFTAHEGDTYINMLGQDVEHNNRLRQAGRAMDDIIGHGQAIKETLYSQREMIKGTKRRLWDVVHTLGLSNTVMRLIEQRTMQDKVILYGGMVLTLLVMWIIYSYLG